MIAVGVRIPPCQPIREVAALVCEAERLGFDHVWHPDSQLLWRDVWSALTAAALATSHIGIGVAATNPVTRHPTVTASAARTVAELAVGRVRVAVGIGDSAITFAGLRPAPHLVLESAVSEIRTLLRGEEVTARDHTYHLRDSGDPDHLVPVYVAASGPRNLAVGGRAGDGAIVAGVDWKAQDAIVRNAAAEAGRPPGEVHVIVTRPCIVTDDPERDAAVLKPMCLRVAQLGGAAAFAEAGFELNVPPHSVADGDLGHPENWSEAVRVASQWIPDEAALWFASTRCLFGSPDDIVAKMAALESQGVTEVLLAHPGAFTMPEELINRIGNDVLPALRSAEQEAANAHGTPPP